MRIISPITVTESLLTDTNLTEDDHDEWDVSTTYSAEDRVIVLSTHKVYESVSGSNLGYDPTTDDGTWWIEVSATNKWKAFDLRLSDQAENAGTITYEITAASLITGIAFCVTRLPSTSPPIPSCKATARSPLASSKTTKSPCGLTGFRSCNSKSKD
ncbi:hypothetical protein ACX9MO_05180 [Pseudooceanicola sp. 502str34]